MKISTIPIHHTIKHLQPIFTFAKSSKFFLTGGMNGEMKLWSLNYDLIKTIKKHSGSLTSVKFSRDENYIASAGDDGKIFIFDNEANEVLKIIKHSCDITHIEWMPDFLISVDMDGAMVLTKILNNEFIEFRKIKDHENSILGLAISPNNKFLCTYSESKIVLYEDFNLKSSVNLDKGFVLENLNSKISFSPNSKFISIGLQFNKKQPTVDIFNLNLKSVFSLVGHVSPSEITAFCPKTFKNIQKFNILAVASQDLSVSIWNTLNPKPFVLLKNFTESPILDMYWDDLTLYLSSYDGIVKKIEFNDNELGELIVEEEEENSELPFSDKNIELQRNYEKRVEKLDFDEPLNFVKLEGYTLNGQKLEEFLKNDENKSLEKKQEIQPKTEPNISSIGSDNIQNKIEGLKPKRIYPTMINSTKIAPIKISKTQSTIVLFDINLPEKLKLEKSIPFKINLEDFSIELDEEIKVFRCKKHFYTIKGPINKVCANKQYLVVYSSHVQIYYLKTGCLVVPYINFKICFMDLLIDKVLLVNPYGDFIVFDLKKMKSIQGKLPKTKNLSKIQLNKRYFILAEYNNPEEIVFYNKSLKMWISVNPHFNSITSNGTDFLNDNDETLSELEVSFAHFRMVNDYKNMCIVAKQIIYLIRSMKRLDEYLEYKIEMIFEELDDDYLELLLEEMNREEFLQKFVVRLSKKFNIK